MKTIKILTVIGVLFFTSFGSEVQAQEKEGYYYFAYASLDKYAEHIYITPLLYISKKDCDISSSQSAGENYDVSNQFNDYMKAEYKGIVYKFEGYVYNDYTFSKAEAQEYRREIMEYAEKITKIWDFEYLCE